MASAGNLQPMRIRRYKYRAETTNNWGMFIQQITTKNFDEKKLQFVTILDYVRTLARTDQQTKEITKKFNHKGRRYSVGQAEK